jgi:hypothetical protein
MAHNWYKLDNAGKIFPMTRTKFDTTFFRLACLLTKEADDILLKQATTIALDRFPSFKVKLKMGIFWFYLETNDLEPIILKESPIITRSNNLREQNDYLFKLCTYGRRVSIEFFHALTDATGGMEFFKAILYHYFTLQGIEFVNHSCILTDEVEELYEETKDSFLLNYDKNIKNYPKDIKGYQIKGYSYKTNFMGAMFLTCSEVSIKNAAKKYGITIGEYISSILIYSIYECYYKNDKSKNKKPIRLFVPVNIRRFFESHTLRNFALFIRTTNVFDGVVTFNDVIEQVKTQFEEELTLPKMQERLAQNMNFEKMLVVRLAPLFLKIPIAKIIFNSVSTNVSTMSFSNLGKVNVPSEFYSLVDRFEFVIPASPSCPVNLSVVTYNNKVELSITNRIVERKIQTSIIRLLKNDGIDFVLETNDMEANA